MTDRPPTDRNDPADPSAPPPVDRVDEVKQTVARELDSWPVYQPPDQPAAAGGEGGESPPGGRGPAALAGGDGGGEWTELDLRLSREPENDMGNANRLIVRFGDDMLHVPDIGWHAYVETVGGDEAFPAASQRWDREEGERWAMIQAHRAAALINREAEALDAALAQKLQDDEVQGVLGARDADIEAARKQRQKDIDKRVGSLRGFALDSGNMAKTRAMLGAAAPYLARKVNDLDAQPGLFAVANGVLELEAPVPGGVRFRPPRREDLMTRQARFVYDPSAEAKTWATFLASAIKDAGTRTFLQRYIGYTLAGHTHEQVVFMHTGVGSNGKSTFIETLERGFGNYALRLPFASLLKDDRKRGGEATPDLARLPGIRFAVAAEPEENVTLSSGTIKQLTERDSMTVRHLNQGFFDFVPQHKLSLMFNEKPNIPATDDGTWRRLLIVLWGERFISEHERVKYPNAPLKDPTLGERLLKELPGILNWALDGWRMYREEGLRPPESVVAATQAYRAENDPVGEFIRVVVEPSYQGDFVSGKDLYHAYKVWADLSAAKRMSNTAFGKKAKTILKAKTSGIVQYEDIRLNAVWWGKYQNTEVKW